MISQNQVLPKVVEFEMEKPKSAVGYSRYLRDDLTNYQRNLYSRLKTQRDKLNETVEQGFVWRIRDFELVRHRKYLSN